MQSSNRSRAHPCRPPARRGSLSRRIGCCGGNRSTNGRHVDDDVGSTGIFASGSTMTVSDVGEGSHAREAARARSRGPRRCRRRRGSTNGGSRAMGPRAPGSIAGPPGPVDTSSGRHVELVGRARCSPSRGSRCTRKRRDRRCASLMRRSTRYGGAGPCPAFGTARRRRASGSPRRRSARPCRAAWWPCRR